jgi:hypothetical protein
MYIISRLIENYQFNCTFSEYLSMWWIYHAQDALVNFPVTQLVHMTTRAIAAILSTKSAKMRLQTYL